MFHEERWHDAVGAVNTSLLPPLSEYSNSVLTVCHRSSLHHSLELGVSIMETGRFLLQKMIYWHFRPVYARPVVGSVSNTAASH